MMLLRLIPAKTDYKFIQYRMVAIGVSAFLMLGSLGLFLFQGLNFGIDFRGGTLIEFETPGPADHERIRTAMGRLNLGDVTVQGFGEPEHVLVRFEEQSGGGDTREAELSNREAVARAQQALHAEYAELTFEEENMDTGFLVRFTKEGGLNLPAFEEWLVEQRIPEEQRRVVPEGDTTARIEIDAPYQFGPTEDDVLPAEEYAAEIRQGLTETQSGIIIRRQEVVGPKVSGELVQAGIMAITLAVLAVLIYIWFRFEWQFAVGAVIALVHDVVLTIGVFSLLQLEFGLAIVAAILTIVGYSLNDTVVVFDRIRENLRKYKRMPIEDLLDLSINDTLSRTVMTSVTTLLALLALYLFGGEVIRGFTFAMIWGVIVGTYSSVFIGSPALLILGVKREWNVEQSPEVAARP